MPEFTSIPCADNYPIAGQSGGAQLHDVFLSGGGVFEVANNAAIYSLQYGGQGVDNWTDDTTIGTGGGVIPPGVTGIRFKNAVAGSIAVVSALIRQKNQPHLSLSFPNSTVNTNLNFQHNEVLVAAESALDFKDNVALTWSVTDDAANGRVQVSLGVGNLIAQLGQATQVNIGASAGFAAVLFGSTGDTNLYRSAAQVLATDSRFKLNFAGVPWQIGNAAAFTGAATGGAAALPANPEKFLSVLDDAGAAFKIPLYKP